MEDILKVGVIGTGAIGREHIKRITTRLQGAKVVAISDLNKDTGENIAEKYNAKFFDNGLDLIADPGVDAVIISTLDPTHAKYVMCAIRNKKYVFCEKPLAEREADCHQIVEAEIAGGKQLVQVGFMRRYDKAYKEIKEIIDDEAFGEVLMLHCTHRIAEVDDHFDTPKSITNTAILDIDILRWLLNENFVSVQVRFPKKTIHSHEDLHDPQILLLETESGVHIDLEIFVNCKYGYDIRCEVCCEDGTIQLAEPRSAVIRNKGTASTGLVMNWKQRFTEAYDRELQEWIYSTREGRVDGPSAWDGYAAQRVVEAASRARENGTIEEIETMNVPRFYK